MKTYNKEVLRYNKNSKEDKYTCSVCKLEDDLLLHRMMKEKVNENSKENKKYKTTVLKIYTKCGNSRNTMENISTVKITTHDDIIRSIDNLEYLENTKLNLPEDEEFLKYGRDVVIKNYDEFIKGDDYKKAIKYFKR